jgi:hypothetical protein
VENSFEGLEGRLFLKKSTPLFVLFTLLLPRLVFGVEVEFFECFMHCLAYFAAVNTIQL